MASASFVEVISHFAGYLQIFHDIARDRIAYDETIAPRSSEDYTTPRPNYEHPFRPDDMETKAGPSPSLIPDDPFDFIRAHPLRKALSDLPDDLDFFPPSRGPNVSIPMPGGGGGGGHPEFHIKVVYQPGGEQSQFELHQHNILSDNDSLLQIDGELAPSPLVLKLEADIAATIQQMVADANNHIPNDWQMPEDGNGATAFVVAHDENWAANGGVLDAHSVQPGYYLNGVLQDPPPPPPDQTPLPEPKPLPDTGHDLGQWAQLGGNISLNAALIIDLGESANTMIVTGDYFMTNAVFQTNTTIDHDHVSASSSAATPVETGDNVANNIADFVQHPGLYASIQATFAGPNWNVDVVDGNYYSVHTLVQTNYLFDNDIATQVSSDTHYNLVGGHNELGNLAQIFDGNLNYDLIVIEGAYHGMNVIFQNNMLLNDDAIKMAAEDAGTGQSASSGKNDLSNEATIEQYGGESFDPLTAGIQAILNALGSGATLLDPSLGTAVAGYGGPFNVLYVKGDYYDVNAVWQTNITSDVNVIYQLQNHPSDVALEHHENGVQTQLVTTGGNSLINDAAIVDVAATNTFVNGHAYTDSILVQANLVPHDQDHALNTDTNALVSELIAFVDDSQDETCAPSCAVPASIHSDPMASVLH